MLSPEQTEQIKEQIIHQIESTFPDEQRYSAIEEIKIMGSEELEKFLEKNGVLKQETPQKCIFCSIVSGEMESHKLEENSEALCVLEINPISKAHSLVIPKKHISSEKEISKNILEFADEISKKIKLKFSPRNVLLSFSNLFGHEIINLVPIYGDETVNSQRHKGEKEELLEIQKILVEKPKEPEKKPEVEKAPEKIWLPRRIP